MADNIDVSPGTGRTIRTDLIAGVDWVCDKMAFGADGSATLVAALAGSAMPIEGVSGGQAVPISGTVTATCSGTVAFSNTTIAVTNAGTFAVQAAQSGTWNITNISGTVSLPTGASTAAKQPALGTAGIPSADVLTIQGVTSMTALAVDGSAVTQPVSGTVTANAGSGTFTVAGAVTQGGTWNVGLSAGTNNIGDIDVLSIAAGDNNIGNVDIVTVPTDPFGANADAASATGSISAKLRFIAATGIPITCTVTVGAHAVTNAGTFAVQSTLQAGSASFGVLGANSGVDIGDVTINNASGVSAVNIQDGGNVITVDGTVAATQSGTWTVGLSAAQTLATVTTVSTVTAVTTLGTITNVVHVDDNAGSLTVDNGGTFAVQASLAPATSGGLSISRVISAATTNATSAKASAGQVFGAYLSNVNASPRYLKLYNKATTPDENDTPVWRMAIPGNTAGAGLAKTFPNGLAFGTGISYRLVAAVADNGTTAVSANEQLINVGYK